MIEGQESIKCNEHNKNVQYVLFNQNPKSKLLCEQCLQEKEGSKTVLNIEEAINQIKKRKQSEYQECQNILQPEILILSNYIEDVPKILEIINQLVRNLIEAINDWKCKLESKLQEFSKFSFIEEIKKVNNQQQSNNQILVELIKTQRQNYSETIKKILHDLKTIITIDYNLNKLYSFLDIEDKSQLSPRKNTQQLYQQNKNVKIEIKQKPNLEILFKGENSELLNVYQLNNLQQMKDQKISIKKQNKTIQQTTQCLAISFNKDDSILATTCDKEIKLWKFQDGNICDLLYSLNEHKSEITTLLFSKKKNWLFSAGNDQQIILWKPKKILFNFDFTKRKIQQFAHRGQIVQLVLNENENQLISCSNDCKIIIWDVNYQQNSIQFYQSLEKHTGPVIQVNLNQSNNLMASISLDKQIIIWSLDDQQVWNFKQVIQNSENHLGYRISFINDQTVVWQQNQGVTHILKEQDGIFKEIPEQKIQIKKNDKKDGEFQFPLIFNSQKQILIQKYLENVYLFTIDQNDNLINQEQYISLENEYNYGNLSNNGKYLVIWCNKQFRVYEIIYD
ncbi:unnamed protein product [Paramecium pentaurelia]|uniref:WD40-repeat-containing domain n=1 Tax=Paramecium pentaurelia TaxID=43138 RepID=A0A8S1U0M6_9CILI|nr:unnamed protein product [Paramecium pentaurelia]